ncbi:MAG: hypothetical protein QOE97_3145 [Pseudonocardiales bacterium]|nr:hypothetical protein [Pseudonocardiales bacterium]
MSQEPPSNAAPPADEPANDEPANDAPANDAPARDASAPQSAGASKPRPGVKPSRGKPAQKQVGKPAPRHAAPPRGNGKQAPPAALAQPGAGFPADLADIERPRDPQDPHDTGDTGDTELPDSHATSAPAAPDKAAGYWMPPPGTATAAAEQPTTVLPVGADGADGAGNGAAEPEAPDDEATVALEVVAETPGYSAPTVEADETNADTDTGAGLSHGGETGAATAGGAFAGTGPARSGSGPADDDAAGGDPAQPASGSGAPAPADRGESSFDVTEVKEQVGEPQTTSLLPSRPAARRPSWAPIAVVAALVLLRRRRRRRRDARG